MKKILIVLVMVASLAACTSQETKTEGEDPNMVLFRENAKVVDAAFKAYSKKDLKEFATYQADSLKVHSAQFGGKDSNKAEFLERSANFFKLINNINVKVTLLPGVDEVTLKTDGSVRAYVIWSADFVNNAPKSELKSYFSLKLDKDHKIYDHDEYFDVSGWFQVASAAPSK
jgi:ABC-type glycerol-3-phosphate transport system substrate-binding protein